MLVIGGLYPLALVASALLVPVLFVIYFLEVDLYERAPLASVAATVAWGLLVGGIVGGAARLASSAGLADTSIDALSGLPGAVALALLGACLAAIGPLSLLRHRAFNDVLDGATFGAIAGAAYGSTVAVFRAGDLLAAGLHPGGDPLAWLLRLTTIGLAQPILLAAAGGSVGAAFWLRSGRRSGIATRSARSVRRRWRSSRRSS